MRHVLFWAAGEWLSPAKLEGLDWILHPTDDPLRTLSSVGAKEFRVGLIAFDPAHVPLSSVEEVVLANHTLEWVALIPRRCLSMKVVMQAIPDTFFDYHTLPPDYPRLANSLGHAYGVAELRRAAAQIELAARGAFSMVGCSPQMQTLYKIVRRTAKADAPVLIIGETGTGKELVARAVHAASSRRKAPFVAVSCAALPENLIQAELFGHEKGAFTDARERRIGRIQAAEGGTLFLDEIGDMPLLAQAAMLRFLQEQTIERLGSRKAIHVDVRVIAATHVDLKNRMDHNLFREDLYYRLNVLRVDVPPLREREGDIELLARVILERSASRYNRRVRGFSRTALDAMNAYPWPGNVRELINRVHRATVNAEGRLITSADMELETPWQANALSRLEDSRERAEQHAIQDALVRYRSISRASAELGVSRMTLYRRLAKYGLKRNGPSSGLPAAETASRRSP